MTTRTDLTGAEIGTVEALDALPVGSVILDAGGMARQTHSRSCGENYWSEAGADIEHDLTSTELLRQFDTDRVGRVVTVLWAPSED